MKSWMVLVLATGCAASKLTHYRSGWSSCRAADQNLIQCGGKEMAQVECYRPEDESCGALAIHYADGSASFSSGRRIRTGQEDSLEPGAVLRRSWPRRQDHLVQGKWARSAITGRCSSLDRGLAQVDAYQIFHIRELDPHSMPLWFVHPAQ